jgi:hypothetical protein
LEDQIYFARPKSTDSREVWVVSPKGEGEKRIVELPRLDPLAGYYHVSKTGQVVYMQFKPGPHDLWITDFH